MSTEHVLIALLIFLLAGIIKGVVGIGLPSASLSMLVQFVDPRAAIAMLLAPMLFSNIWQVYRGGRVRESFRILWPFAVCCMLFTWLAARQVGRVAADPLVLLLGCTIVLFAVTSFLKPPPPVKKSIDRPLQVIAGSLAGILGGLTAIWGPPMIMYLLARRPTNEEFVRFTGFLFLLGSVPLFLGYWESGLLTTQLTLISLLMVIPTILGFSLGEQLRPRLNQDQFRILVLALFVIMGSNLIRRVLWPG